MKAQHRVAAVLSAALAGCGAASDGELAARVAPHPLRAKPSCFVHFDLPLRVPGSSATLAQMLAATAQMQVFAMEHFVENHRILVDAIIAAPEESRWLVLLSPGVTGEAERSSHGPDGGRIQLRFLGSAVGDAELHYDGEQSSIRFSSSTLTWNDTSFRVDSTGDRQFRRGCDAGQDLVWDTRQVANPSWPCADDRSFSGCLSEHAEELMVDELVCWSTSGSVVSCKPSILL